MYEKIFLIVAVLAAIASTGTALSCYRCEGLDNPDDPCFNGDTSGMSVETCNHDPSSMCYRYTLEIGTQARGCSPYNAYYCEALATHANAVACDICQSNYCNDGPM